MQKSVIHDSEDGDTVSESSACKVEGLPTLFEMDTYAEEADFFSKILFWDFELTKLRA